MGLLFGGGGGGGGAMLASMKKTLNGMYISFQGPKKVDTYFSHQYSPKSC